MALVIDNLKNGWYTSEGPDSFMLKNVEGKILYESQVGFEVGMHNADKDKSNKAFDANLQHHIDNLSNPNGTCILEKTFDTDNYPGPYCKSGLIFNQSGKLLLHEKAFCECFDLNHILLIGETGGGWYRYACCYNNVNSGMSWDTSNDFLLTKELQPMAGGFHHINYKSGYGMDYSNMRAYKTIFEFYKVNKDKTKLISDSMCRDYVSRNFAAQQAKLTQELIAYMQKIGLGKYL